VLDWVGSNWLGVVIALVVSAGHLSQFRGRKGEREARAVNELADALTKILDAQVKVLEGARKQDEAKEKLMRAAEEAVGGQG